MKTNLKLLAVLIMNLAFLMSSFAATSPRPYSYVVQDGLRYEYYTSNSRNYVCVKAENKYITNVNIAKSVVLDGVECEVTDIQYSGFAGCTKITQIDIPDNITNIGFNAFKGCTGLETLTIPSSVEELGYDCFRGCTSLSRVDFECSDIVIGSGVFMGCSSLKEVYWPSMKDTIPSATFRDCTSLIIFQRKVMSSVQNKATPIQPVRVGGISLRGIKTLKSQAFRNCKAIKNIINTDSLEAIESNALYECTSLKELQLSEKIRIIESTSLPSSLESMVIKASFDDYSFLWSTGISAKTTIYLPSKEILKIMESGYASSKLSPLEIWPYFKLEVKGYLTCLKGILTRIDDKAELPEIRFNNEPVLINDNEFWLECLEPDNIYTLQFNDGNYKDIYVKTSEVKDFLGRVSDTFLCGFNCMMYELDSAKIHEQTIEEKGIKYNVVNSTDFKYQKDLSIEAHPEDSNIMNMTCIRGLEPDVEYEYTAYVKINGKKYSCSSIHKVKTKRPSFEVNLLNNTQTTLTLNVVPEIDETSYIKEMGFEFGGNRIKADSDGNVTIKGLTANRRYQLKAFAVYQNESLYSGYQTFYTKGIDANISVDNLTPTSVSLRAKCDEGDAKIGKIELSCGPKASNSRLLNLNQLDPDKSYSAYLSIYDDNDNIIGNCSKSFDTKKLIFTTLPAKATSNSVAVLCATTNISDEEAETGFEWRRYDAPDLVPSTQSSCPNIDGELIGALKNLSANTYYKYRPYYTSVAGNTYYGDWLAFGTADAYVYFDPTVKTYNASDITANSAIIHGYVITGSGKILKQGFEYWVVKDKGTKITYAISAPEINVVEATGTTINVMLSNLLPETKYAYRVFAETDEGMVYGEERTFMTDESSIDNVSTTAIPITIVGYYDLQGHKLDTLIKGVCIIRYSDGTSRKILIK